MEVIEFPKDGKVEMYNYKEAVNILLQQLNTSEVTVRGVKENARSYSNIIMTFDIETTKVLNENYDRKTMPKMFEYFNVTFCWQVCINGIFIFGRAIEDFFKFLDAVNNVNKSIYIICYVHNLAYEMNNLKDFFFSRLSDPEQDAFFKNTTTALYLRCGRFEFRCSKELTHKSLAKLGSDIGYDKLKGDFSYTKERYIHTELDPLEMNYCYRDVFILYKFILNEVRTYCPMNGLAENPANLPLTSTGYVRRDVQKNFSKQPTGRIILQKTALTEKVYDDINNAFWGGFTHADYKKICKPFSNVGHRDLTSAYPTQFLSMFPYKLTEGQYMDVDNFKQNLQRTDFAMIANITLKGNIHIKKHKIPYLPESKCRGKTIISENGKVLMADEVTFWACEIDIRIILQVYRYEELILNKWYWGNKKPLPYRLVDTVLTYFEKKTMYKGIPEKDIEYRLSKAHLNGVYGMAGTSLRHDKLSIEGLQVNATDSEYTIANTLVYQWAIYITAGVRAQIYSFIDDLATKFDDAFIYSDTDSIFYQKSPATEKYFAEYNEKNRAHLELLSKFYPNLIPCTPKGIPQYLGSFEDEDNDIASFITLGAKRYAISHSDGFTDITFAGLSATKVYKDDEGKKHNGYNTQRFIDQFGSVEAAFQKIKDSNLSLDYVEGVDKLSNYNTIAPYSGHVCGVHVTRPCSYVLYGQGTTLSLNAQILKVLTLEGIDEELF